MGPRLRVGVIGAGYFAAFHHEAWARMTDVDLVALCDVSAEKAAAAARRHRVLAVHSDPAEFLAGGPYDIVDIVTPPPTHLDLIRAAVRVARLVVCQKPFCATLEAARQSAEISAASGVPVVVHENFRFQPWYRAVRALIEEGRLGRLYQATFRLRPGDGRGPDAYLDRQPYFRDMERFLVHETAIHFVDVFRYLFGDPDAVFADLRRLNPAIRGEDAGLFLLRYGDGFRAVFDGNRLADHAARDRRLTMGEMEIDCQYGTLRLDGDGRLFARAHGADVEKQLDLAFPDKGFGGDCVHALQRHVADHLLAAAAIENTASQYLRNLEIEAALYASHAQKAWIDLDPRTIVRRP
jgi:D-apiose dehydrogenase